MAINQKTQEAIESIHNGTLATTLRSTMKYVATGIGLGAIIGIGIATFTGKSRWMVGFGSAIAGGSIGYLISPKEKK